ncbi:MAG TPA: AraC family transcriptional regulator, partial [Burkholderiaceae bacterium]
MRHPWASSSQQDLSNCFVISFLLCRQPDYAMPDHSIREQYIARLQRVTTYIHDNLDAPLDLNTLADVAHLSPWHWHRTYHATFGETVAATVKRLRLHRAAGLLAHGELPVAEVARLAGYPNLQSFTRIFEQTYGMPPARYRKQGSHVRFTQPILEGDPMVFEVTIRQMPEVAAVGVPHRGSYMDIGKSFEQLFGVLGSRGLLGGPIRMVAVYYDDPDAVAEADLRSCAGVVLAGSTAVELPITALQIAGGRYAVLRY